MRIKTKRNYAACVAGLLWGLYVPSDSLPDYSLACSSLASIGCANWKPQPDLGDGSLNIYNSWCKHGALNGNAAPEHLWGCRGNYHSYLPLKLILAFYTLAFYTNCLLTDLVLQINHSNCPPMYINKPQKKRFSFAFVKLLITSYCAMIFTHATEEVWSHSIILILMSVIVWILQNWECLSYLPVDKTHWTADALKPSIWHLKYPFARTCNLCKHQVSVVIIW